jgi:hypothetical protein
MIKLDIRHLPEVQAALRDRAARIAPAFVKAATVSRRLLVAALTAYPAPPSGSTYDRTEQLTRGWERASPITGGKAFELINPVAHAKWVQGDAQAAVHRGRWRTASQIAHDLQEEVMAAYEDALKEAIQ